MFIRYIDEKTFVNFGRTRYYGDSVYNRRRDAELRKAQLEKANYYAIITEKDNTTGREFSVWRSKSDRRGTSQTKTGKIRELFPEEKEVLKKKGR